jgi:hypothetical protein
MDPQATWTMLIDAYQSQDWEGVEESAEALLGWLARGGFPPRLDCLDDRGSRLVVRLFCSQALQSVPQADR